MIGDAVGCLDASSPNSTKLKIRTGEHVNSVMRLTSSEMA